MVCSDRRAMHAIAVALAWPGCGACAISVCVYVGARSVFGLVTAAATQLAAH